MKLLSELSTAYLEHCQYSKNLSEHSIRAYEQDLKNFKDYLSLSNEEETVEPRHIEQFVRYLSEKKGLSARSIKRKVACLSVFYNWLEDSEKIEKNPVSKARISLRLAKTLPRAISRQDLTKIAKNSNTELLTNDSKCLATDKNYTTLLSVLIMSCTGIRVGELVRIMLSDIDLSTTKIKIHGKGSRERYVYITSAELLALLTEYHKSRVEIGSDFENLLLNSRGKPLSEQVIRLRLKRVSESAIGKKITPHALRHTAATLLIEQNVDIRFVQRLLGHQSIATTEIYTHVSDLSLARTLNDANHLRGII